MNIKLKEGNVKISTNENVLLWDKVVKSSDAEIKQLEESLKITKAFNELAKQKLKKAEDNEASADA